MLQRFTTGLAGVLLSLAIAQAQSLTITAGTLRVGQSVDIHYSNPAKANGVVTVLIDDYTISTAVKENVATDNRTRGLAVNARLPTSAQNVGLDARNTADQQQRGQARRENRFQNEMSVRVVAVGPNGLLQVKGTKNIDVDKAMQAIEFTGWIRAQDISTSNMVESSRVADAQIGYASPGPLGKPKQGMVTKILGALWP